MANPKSVRNFSSVLRAPGFSFRGEGKFGFGVRVINKTGSDIAVDKLVYISGFDLTSKLPTIALADADAANKYADVYATLAAIKNGKQGDVFKGGLSSATLNTNSVTTVGDPVYLSTTAGGFTATAPTATNSVQMVVGFTTVKSATVGQIQWDILRPQKFGSNDFQTAVVGGTIDSVTLDTGGAGSTIEVAPSFLAVATGTITSANITGTSAGQLGHANGVVLVPACAAGSVNQFVSLVISNDFATAAYTGGGNTTVNISGGGAALSGLVSNANFIQASSDKIIEFVPLAATFNNYGTGANGIALVTASAPTQPGTAAGVFKWACFYRTVPLLD